MSSNELDRATVLLFGATEVGSTSHFQMEGRIAPWFSFSLNFIGKIQMDETVKNEFINSEKNNSKGRRFLFKRRVITRRAGDSSPREE